MKQHFCRSFACIRAVLSLILIASMLSTPLVCFAEQNKSTVRIGYVQLQGFLYKSENDSFGGIAYEMLNEISIYNGWDYEFIQTPYSEAKQLLQSGEIDLFLPMQYSDNRAEILEYSANPFCTQKASLLTKPDSKICYNDFEQINGITVGAVSGTINGAEFQNFLEKNDCKIVVKTNYKSQDELLAALYKNEIDAFISGSNRGVTDCKIISELPEAYTYAVANKGDRSLLDLLDSAISKVEISMPGFHESLNEKYQISSGGAYPNLTSEEVEYVAKKKSVTVLLNAEECDETGDFTSSAKVMFNELTKLTGLEFVPKPNNNTTQLLSDITTGEYDMLYSFNHDYEWAEAHNSWITKSYAGFYNKIIKKSDTEKINKVAVVPGTYFEYYVKNVFNYDTIECKSYIECIDAVLSEKADATYCNSLIGNYYATFPKYRTLLFLSTYDFYCSYCLAVSKATDPILVSILNKALTCIPQTVLSTVFEARYFSRATTLSDVFYSNPILFVAVLILVVLVLVVIIFLIIYSAKIKKKNRQLALANNAKTEFLSSMSHDMRTPMNGILGLAQLSEKETDIQVIHENLEQIKLSGKFLLDLINDTLDMNRIESSKMELNLKLIDSEDIFKNILSNVKVLADKKGVNLELQMPNIMHGKWTPVMADSSRIEQILMNVISNAIKFTQPGGTVALIMETVAIEKDYVKDKYIIRDNGIGMSEEFLRHIFEPFSQEKRMNNGREEGTGLGMPIVKKLVELMGGEISIKSKLNEGTEVTLLMKYPRSQIIEKQESGSVTDLSVLSGKTVLVCEDHPVNAKIIIKMLEQKGMKVELAENGKIGVEMFNQSEEGHYDLVLMDIRMPVMNGLDATGEIRKLPRADASGVPIYAMTANAFDTDVENCLKAGMNGHLAKPIDQTLLYNTLAKVL